MDKRWRNLAAFFAVIAVLALAYFFFVPAEGFSERVAVMRSYWEKYDIEEPLHLSYRKLNSLSEGELGELKTALLQFNESEQNPAARELSGAYASLVDVSIYSRKMLEKQAELDNTANPCAALAEYDELTSYKEQLLSSTQSYLQKVDSFVSNNPAEAEQIAINQGSGTEGLEEAVEEHKQLVAQLKGVCK